MSLLLVLMAIVAALYAASTVLIGTALARQRWQARADARARRRVEAFRGTFEAYVIDGTPLPREATRQADAILDLGLRYSTVVRGREAARIIECLEDLGLVDHILAQLAARGTWRRARAADALGRLRVQRAVPQLIAALDDKHEDVRTVAARALASIGDTRAIAPLALALDDPSRWTLSLVAENLMAMGSEAVQPLIDLLLSENEHNVQVAAIKILGEIRDPAATPALVSVVLGEQNLNLRSQAAAALGRLGGPIAEGALLVAIDDAEWQVRAQAAKALGRVGNQLYAHVLARAMPDPQWWVRVNCAEALTRLGPPGIEALEELTEHPDPYVREQATAAFELFGLKRRGHIPAANPAGSAS